MNNNSFMFVTVSQAFARLTARFSNAHADDLDSLASHPGLDSKLDALARIFPTRDTGTTSIVVMRLISIQS